MSEHNPRNSKITITDLTRGEARTIYALLTGLPVSNLMDSTGFDFCGPIAMKDHFNHDDYGATIQLKDQS